MYKIPVEDSQESEHQDYDGSDLSTGSRHRYTPHLLHVQSVPLKISVLGSFTFPEFSVLLYGLYSSCIQPLREGLKNSCSVN